MLVRRLAEYFQARGASSLDLSVLHDNEPAIGLYESLGFRRIPLFAVKRKNPINEKLFSGPIDRYEALNPYARIIVDEARRRGVHAEVTDAEGGFFRLSYGGRSIHCRESLSELTSGVAVSVCDDKAVTRRIVARAGVAVPEQIATGDDAAVEAFLAEHGSVVVKPARGEQGRGVSVGLTRMDDVAKATAEAAEICDRVLVESCFDGQDLRLVVIDHKLVAAAIRRPPSVVGDGQRSLAALIERQSRRRAAATEGESRIPVDEETLRCLAAGGRSLDTVPAEGEEVIVRKTANLHTGGSIHDVTGIVHPALVEAAKSAARHSPTTSLSRPTSGLGLPTTNRSRRPSASSTCCFHSPARVYRAQPERLHDSTRDRHGIPSAQAPPFAGHRQPYRPDRQRRPLL